ncbi:MAG: bis(5'-nucleosyl)-tetraphosphatase [Bacteroidota bacterium]
MEQKKSCGILLFDSDKFERFLLMEHKARLDLPKGHIENGERELECAFREFEEETGISPDNVKLLDDFSFEEKYIPDNVKGTDHEYMKKLIIFLGYLKKSADITLTEHLGYRWVIWDPPHDIQKYTINPLLKEVEEYFNIRNLN